MVRRCCVQGCPESDKSIIAHRFPKTASMAVKWQEALDLQRLTLDELQKRFVVCTKHFSASSYRNELSNCLNTTAIPSLNQNLCNERAYTKMSSIKRYSSSAPIVELVTEAAERLQPKRSKREVISTVIIPMEEAETFEMREYSEDESAAIDNVLESSIAEEESSIVEEQVELRETPQEPEAAEETPEEISKCDQETQTEMPVINESVVTEEIIARGHEKESKDEKLISILYPEYQGMKKIELIEAVNEKNRKIESLEEKVKKLELAMRNLL